jgi:hypothetical protein
VSGFFISWYSKAVFGPKDLTRHVDKLGWSAMTAARRFRDAKHCGLDSIESRRFDALSLVAAG